jgi:glycerol-3-phosphate dehydrogenase
VNARFSEGSSTQRSRLRIRAALMEQPLDVLVVGGGIVGAGIVRDAAMRGLRAGLVEQHDFTFGTSSRSSRLLHGGMRYLAQGRLKLVRESSVEKKIIHKIAPHIADPLPFVFPAYQDQPEWVLWQLKAGVKIYDLLCSGRNFGKSTWLNPKEALELAPVLRAGGLKGAVRYYDGFTNDARLVLDTLRSAERAGGWLLNYCRLGKAEKGKLWDCEIQDSEVESCFRVSAKTVVNATGAWASSLPHSQVKLRLTKGIHIVVERERLPLRDTIVMTDRKRILFAIPWGERSIIGTTDTDYSGPLDRVFAEASEIRYLLEVANRFFPVVRLSSSDVISAWAGLRPLIADEHGMPSDISRAHEICSPEPGWWDVAGGKLTTYRLMAQQTVDQIVHWLRGSKSLPRDVKSCRTADEPLLPVSETEGLSGIVPPKPSRRLIEHFCAQEWVVRLEDVMIRRTGWHVYHANPVEIAEQVVDWLAEALGWPPEQRAAELEQYRQLSRARTGPPQPQPAPA